MTKKWTYNTVDIKKGVIKEKLFEVNFQRNSVMIQLLSLCMQAENMCKSNYCEIIINPLVLNFVDFVVDLNHENKNQTKI